MGNADYERIADESLNAFGRLDRRAQLVVLIVLAVGGIIAAVLYYRAHHVEPTQQATQAPTAPATQTVPSSTPRDTTSEVSPHLLLGNPSGATPDPTNRTNYLMVKPFYALAYNDATATPNWVSWRVTSADLGDAPRKQVFATDMTLPSGFYRVTHKDYSGSGFDRGHMCPHSDRAATTEMSYATFVMTNIIPQAPHVNQKAWAQLENYCRDLVRGGNHLYIVAGPYGHGGVGSNGPAETVAHERVTVPAECWKVIVVVPESGGPDDLLKVGASTRVIVVIMPNDNTAVGEEWAGFRTSTAKVERRTGYHFFDRVPADVADTLRGRVDDVAIAAPHPVNRGRE